MIPHNWVPWTLESDREAWKCTECQTLLVQVEKPGILARIGIGPKNRGYTCQEMIVKRIHDA